MNQKYKYLIIASLLFVLLTLSACAGNSAAQEAPIIGFSRFWDFLVWPMTALLWCLGHSVAFGNYAVAIILATLIIRTIAWPIYAKTNDMSMKMELMRGDQEKIEKRYQGRTDPESARRKQMEMMQLYKKYGLGIGGCLGPLLQLPIFLAFYQTLRRIPFTVSGVTSSGEIVTYPLNFGDFSQRFLGVDLFSGRSGAFFSAQNIGIYVLCILVAASQVLNQILISRRQKKQKLNAYSHLPDYRRPQQTDQQKSQSRMMQIMMYGMAAMMVIFVFQSTAALGLYWVVGNLYSAGQAYLSYKMSDKRKLKIMDKYKK